MNSKTIVIATIGPSSGDIEIIRDMIKNHMDMARLNFSWGNHEKHQVFIDNIRKASIENNIKIPIIQDLMGPRIQKDRGTHHFDEKSTSIISEKDIKDLYFGIENKLEYVALSFVGEGKDIIDLRKLIEDKGGNQKIIAKIERRQAVENISDIIRESDMVMVARGDLGNEYDLEEIPFIQHRIIKEAKKHGKMVIVATQMLLSMTDNPIPTRAEVSDVAYAILDGADGVMLSEESATGKYPVEAVNIMDKIAIIAEKNRDGEIKIG